MGIEIIEGVEEIRQKLSESMKNDLNNKEKIIEKQTEHNHEMYLKANVEFNMKQKEHFMAIVNRHLR